MTYKEITVKSEGELRNLLSELRGQVHDLAVKARLNQLKNTNQIRAVKKDIARVLTFLAAKKS